MKAFTNSFVENKAAMAGYPHFNKENQNNHKLCLLFVENNDTTFALSTNDFNIFEPYNQFTSNNT